MEILGKTLAVFGLMFLGVGIVLLSGFGEGWFGRLQGDTPLERPHAKVHFPVVTCLLLSILGWVILTVLRH